uniref:Uncharacterized protein n=1 Tax=Ditylenchus dipsaci TaxID=166011 RepID=A0A915E9L1_9BILA
MTLTKARDMKARNLRHPEHTRSNSDQSYTFHGMTHSTFCCIDVASLRCSFPVSEFTFPATIPPVKSRAASHSSQPIKGSTSISNSQEPNALSSTFISFEHHAPSSSYSSSDIYTARELDSDTTSSNISQAKYEQILKELSLASSYIFQDGTPEQQAPRSDAGWVKCASSSGRLVSHMFRPPPPVTSMPYAGEQPAQPSVPVSCQSSGLQLIQSCYGDSSDDEEDLQSTEFNSLLTSVIPPVSIKSLSMCTDSAASITPRPKCSGIDSHPMSSSREAVKPVITVLSTCASNTMNVEPTGLVCSGNDSPLHEVDSKLNSEAIMTSIVSSCGETFRPINSTRLVRHVQCNRYSARNCYRSGTNCPISSSGPVNDARVDPVRVTPVNSVFQVDANKRTVPYSSSSINSYQPGAYAQIILFQEHPAHNIHSHLDRLTRHQNDQVMMKQALSKPVKYCSQTYVCRQKFRKGGCAYALYPTDTFGKKGSRNSSDQSLVIETPRESSTDEVLVQFKK